MGLSEFDLAPNEIITHTNLMNCLKNTQGLTKRRGNEEPLINHSATLSARTRYLLNTRYLSPLSEIDRRNSDESNDLIECDEYPLGFNLSTPVPISYNNSLLPGYNSMAHSINSSMLSPFNNDEGLKFMQSNLALKKPRPSAVVSEKNVILNGDTEFVRQILSFGSYESILGKVHLEMCKYHENGRFLNHENDDFDCEAAFFHLQQSANLGVTESLTNIAKIYMQLPHDILPEYKVEVRFLTLFLAFLIKILREKRCNKNVFGLIFGELSLFF
jgi:hypothetical protein